MKLVCYAIAQHQSVNMERFIKGLERHGMTAEIRNYRTPEDCDIAVMWGHRQRTIMNRQKQRKAHYLVMERGYIGDRFVWTSLGFDGLNGMAKFPKIDDGRARWNKHFAKFMKPWKKSTTNLAVIMGQCRGDAALAGLDFQLWAAQMGKKLQDNRFVTLFRPHPGDPALKICGVKTIEGTLDEALAQARLVVTYNSNSGVDAVLAGVSTYAEHEGSMAWPVSGRNLSPIQPDRDKWCDKMAYTQWLPEEIENGDAWAAVRTVLPL